MIGWILFVPGVVIAVIAAIAIIQNVRTTRWLPQDATIVGFSTEPARSGKVHLKPAYNYMFEGRHYSGDRYSVPAKSFTPEEAKALATKYYAGRSITVYRNPSDPGESAVETSFPAWTVGMGVLGMSLLAYGLAMIQGH